MKGSMIIHRKDVPSLTEILLSTANIPIAFESFFALASVLAENLEELLVFGQDLRDEVIATIIQTPVQEIIPTEDFRVREGMYRIRKDFFCPGAVQQYEGRLVMRLSPSRVHLERLLVLPDDPRFDLVPTRGRMDIECVMM